MASAKARSSSYATLSTRARYLYTPSNGERPAACRICAEWVNMMRPSLLRQGFAERDINRCHLGVDPWTAICMLDAWDSCPDPSYHRHRQLLYDEIILDLRKRMIESDNAEVSYEFWAIYPLVHNGLVLVTGDFLHNRQFPFAADDHRYAARLSHWRPAPKNSSLMWQCDLEIDCVVFHAIFQFKNLEQEGLLFLLQDNEKYKWPPIWPMVYPAPIQTPTTSSDLFCTSHTMSASFGDQPSWTGTQGF